MFRFDPALKVYLHREAVDGRKNINGLALLVEQALGLDPFAPALFVFSNRRRDRVKILLWERTGFWLIPVGFFDRNPALDIPPAAHCGT